jgi:hypothetical protein
MAGCGINPAFFDDAVSLSSDAEPFVLSYLKLKDVLPESHSLETVILSCSYPEIFLREDDFFKNNRSLAIVLFRRISFYNDLPSFRYFRPFTDNPILYYEAVIRNRILLLQALRIYGRGGLERVPHIRGYQHVNIRLDSGFVDKDDGKVNVDYKHYSEEYDNSLIKNEWNDLAYIDSIIQFTQEKDLRLVLVAMPVNSNLFNVVSDECKGEFKLIKHRFSQYEHVKFLDFTNLIEDPSFFKDHVHVRPFGADSISKVIYSHINKNY